jgi:hypothetical protein
LIRSEKFLTRAKTFLLKRLLLMDNLNKDGQLHACMCGRDKDGQL